MSASFESFFSQVGGLYGRYLPVVFAGVATAQTIILIWNKRSLTVSDAVPVIFCSVFYPIFIPLGLLLAWKGEKMEFSSDLSITIIKD